jgi:hypothetical protein
MFISGTGSEFFPCRIPGTKRIPGSQILILIRIKEFKYFSLKNLSILAQKIVSKLSEIRLGIFIPDPDLDFLPIQDPDPGVKQIPNPGSGSATLLVRDTK